MVLNETLLFIFSEREKKCLGRCFAGSILVVSLFSVRI
jgi:hypothetical protein